MKSSSLPFILSGMVLVGAAYGGWKVWQSEQVKRDRSNVYGVEETINREPLESFTLTESSGKPFDSESLKGEVWAGYIFFVDCPTVCLRMSKTVASLAGQDGLEDMKFVSITCDPDNDTPERLDDYAKMLGADRDRWFFLTGDLDYIKRVGEDILKVSIKRLTHSERLIVVDRTGAVRGSYHLLDPHHLEEAQKKMVELLKEDAPEPESKPTQPVSEEQGGAKDSKKEDSKKEDSKKEDAKEEIADEKKADAKDAATPPSDTETKTETADK